MRFLMGIFSGFLGLVVILLPRSPEARAYEPTVRAAKGYEEIAGKLEDLINHEVKEKGLPAISIALIDDQKTVWAKGFGYQDPNKKVMATADTVYRVGSVSKLFTDLAVMQLVERGVLDLDERITKYLPNFKPVDPFGKPITLRQLMAHRSGLVRESPEGHYFDPEERSLTRMVSSLNRTELLHEPGSKMQYSNAGISVVGAVLEETQKQPFARYLSKSLLAQLGMKHSSFEPEPGLVKDLAKATMWTYHGRDFPAPTFELGEAPAGSMYSTVLDLGKFVSVLLAQGKAPGGIIIKPETLEKMWQVQFAKEGEKTGFGLGFNISQFEGHRRVGHNGAIYGFATELAILPEDKIGVVVAISRDCANAVGTHIADEALKMMLALKQSKPLPEALKSDPLPLEQIRKLAGRYKSGPKTIDLTERDGHLWLLPAAGGFRVELRKLGDNLIVDDRLGFGARVEIDGDKLKIGKDLYERAADDKPPPAPENWLGLIGEYGWDHNTLFIFEKDGKLHALIEWFFDYPLDPISANVFKFPGFGLYPNEKLVFEPRCQRQGFQGHSGQRSLCPSASRR